MHKTSRKISQKTQTNLNYVKHKRRRSKIIGLSLVVGSLVVAGIVGTAIFYNKPINPIKPIKQIEPIKPIEPVYLYPYGIIKLPYKLNLVTDQSPPLIQIKKSPEYLLFETPYHILINKNNGCGYINAVLQMISNEPILRDRIAANYSVDKSVDWSELYKDVMMDRFSGPIKTNYLQKIGFLEVFLGGDLDKDGEKRKYLSGFYYKMLELNKFNDYDNNIYKAVYDFNYILRERGMYDMFKFILTEHEKLANFKRYMFHFSPINFYSGMTRIIRITNVFSCPQLIIVENETPDNKISPEFIMNINNIDVIYYLVSYASYGKYESETQWAANIRIKNGYCTIIDGEINKHDGHDVKYCFGLYKILPADNVSA